MFTLLTEFIVLDFTVVGTEEIRSSNGVSNKAYLWYHNINEPKFSYRYLTLAEQKHFAQNNDEPDTNSKRAVEFATDNIDNNLSNFIIGEMHFPKTLSPKIYTLFDEADVLGCELRLTILN